VAAVVAVIAAALTARPVQRVPPKRAKAISQWKAIR
jgi:hypothetical protein